MDGPGSVCLFQSRAEGAGCGAGMKRRGASPILSRTARVFDAVISPLLTVDGT